MLKILVGYLVIAAALGASVLLFTEREAADWSLAFACLVGVAGAGLALLTQRSATRLDAWPS